MTRSTILPWAAVLACGLQLFAVAVVLAHGSEAAIEVEPSTITAGGSVTLAGENLEANDERVIVLRGPDVTLDLGTVQTDEMGGFSLTVAIPGHLPAGVYEFQAIGDETLTVELNVEAGPSSATASTPPAAEPARRVRSGIELVVVVLAVAAATAVGTFLVLRAESLGRGVA